VRGSEDITLPLRMGTYVYLPEVTGAQLQAAAQWLDGRTAALQCDTGGFLHVDAGEDRMVFDRDGTSP
jgi:hypothetical protein